jgi:hypothetical protein
MEVEAPPRTPCPAAEYDDNARPKRERHCTEKRGHEGSHVWGEWQEQPKNPNPLQLYRKYCPEI